MPKPCKLLTLIVLVVLTACGGGLQGESEDGPVRAEASFATFAQEFYRRLAETPLSDTAQVEIGMFGDLNVMPGEHVVMGRYRYRVDSTQDGVAGHMTFFARSAADSIAVPVVLALEVDDGAWALRDAGYIPSDAGSSEPSTVEPILDEHLDAWTAAAARGAASSTVRVFP